MYSAKMLQKKCQIYKCEQIRPDSVFFDKSYHAPIIHSFRDHLQNKQLI